MNLKLLILLALLCVSSCRKSDNSTPQEESDMTVILRLDLPGSRVDTRASIEAPITSTIVDELHNVDIYLYNRESGVIYFTESLDDEQLTEANSVNGLYITNLHANIDAITIVCNNTEAKNLNTAIHTQISALFAKKVNIALEQDFNNLTYIGTDNSLVKVNTPTGGDDDIDYFNALVFLAPLVARVEISNIYVTNREPFPYIRLRSVFIDNVYSGGVRLDYLENLSASTPNILAATATEVDNSIKYWWRETLEAPNTGFDADLSETPWSPKYGDPAVDGVFVFHIFEKGTAPTLGLSMDAFTSSDTQKRQYVKFGTYTGASGLITSFKAGSIYKINPLFDGVNNMKDFDGDYGELTLSITVREWTIHDDIITGY